DTKENIMTNFEFKNPTKIIFGKGEIAKISREIPQDARILLVYGGGSIKQNGVYDQIQEALKAHTVYEFAGVTANNEYEILLKDLEVVKEKELSYLIAVGGGHVIDAVNYVSAAPGYEGDPWEVLKKSLRPEEGKGIPFGTFLTLAATGSEMNSGYVI